MNILHIVSIICFAFCLIIFFYLKWYVKKRTSSIGLLDEYRIEVGKLIAEIDNATDRDSQLVEDRIKQLKIILEEADKRISVYVKELEKSKTGEALYTSLGRGIRAALSAEQEPVLSSVRSALAPSARIEVPRMEPVKKPPSKKQIRAHIDLLLNEGKTAEEIASELEISMAEVNLAMNLRRGKNV